MNYPIMPALPISMARGLKKTPNFNTVKQTTAAGMTSAVSLKPYPTWDFELSLDNIQGQESASSSVLAQFMSVYMATAGGAGLFLFTDPQDNQVTATQFGTGNGSAVSFQLGRSINGAIDIIQNWQGTPSIYINGSLTSTVIITPTGVVTFSAAPASGAVLTVTGSFYFLCRFSDDTLDAIRSYTTNSGLDHWMVQGIKFCSEYVSASSTGVVNLVNGGVTYSSSYQITVPVVGTTLPTMDSIATIGSTGKWADAGHIHPTDTSRVASSTTVNGHALSSNIIISASDITTGTLPSAQLPSVLSATQINGATLSSLATGMLKNTASTGVPTIAVAGTDYVAPSGNITGTAANLSGTPVLPNGTTATTQTAGDNSTKLATTAYVASALTSAGASTVGIAGTFRNLVASATGLNTNVSVTADEVMLENSSNYYVTARGISLTIACTTSGANGLDTGTVAASTWYSVWVINNGTTTAGLLSLSATAPTMPSGYTFQARIGWIRTDSVNKYPLSFTQRGRKVQYKVVSGGNLTGLPLLCSGTQGDVTTPSWIGFSVVSYVPTTASVVKFVATSNGSSSIESCISPNNAAGTFGSSSNSPMGGGASWGKTQCEIILETTTIYVGAQANTWVNVVGWEDNL
jgi:hypothetical protein